MARARIKRVGLKFAAPALAAGQKQASNDSYSSWASWTTAARLRSSMVTEPCVSYFQQWLDRMSEDASLRYDSYYYYYCAVSTVSIGRALPRGR